MELVCISVLMPKSSMRSYTWLKPTDDARRKLDELKAQKGEMFLMFKDKRYAHPSSVPKSIYYMTQ